MRVSGSADSRGGEPRDGDAKSSCSSATSDLLIANARGVGAAGASIDGAPFPSHENKFMWKFGNGFVRPAHRNTMAVRLSSRLAVHITLWQVASVLLHHFVTGPLCAKRSDDSH